jgi:predicted dehydrogenase
MLDALARQADAFAELIRGGPRRGAETADAVAALRVAARASEASSGSTTAVTET